MTNLSGTNLNNGAAVGPQGEGRDSPSRFPKYPAYKDSGVEWLGEVPEGWILARGDAYLRSQAKVVSADYLGGKEVFHYSIPAVQATGDGQLEDGDEIDSSKLLVEQPQVLISKLNPRKNTVCLAGPREVVTVCSGEFVPLQSDCMDLKWVYYLVSSENFKKRLESLVESATRSHQRVNPSDILKFRGAFPLLAEQTQIARFLDHETTRIDALIEEQQRLIELLKEKRQAVISHAVTKGLDPTVPMKDSGVEWLGEVPAHWIISQLKFNTTEMQTGPFGSQLHAEDYIDGGIPLINPAHMVDGRIIPDFQVSVDEETWSRLSRHALKAGEIIFARRGELGRCAVVSKDQEGWLCGTGSLKASLNSRLSSECAYLLVTSKGVVSELSLESKGSTMENLNTETLGRVRLPLPPLSEQETILEHVHEISGQFAALINEAEDGIKLITERRSALISAAVTGKIDVRGWQPPVSTQAPKLEAAEAV